MWGSCSTGIYLRQESTAARAGFDVDKHRNGQKSITALSKATIRDSPTCSSRHSDEQEGAGPRPTSDAAADALIRRHRQNR